ncbi:MAG: NAD(P)H-dependent oxidoreductase [Planctomycetota bacterium]|nr:NAD(P)H-dependent oxidoreductase [Planctomycetota bacterium]
MASYQAPRGPTRRAPGVWWFAPPAILKGWVDRVLVDGVALRHDHEPPSPLLSGRTALLVQTFHAPRVVDRLLMRRLSYRFWRDAVFGSVGVRKVTPLALYEAKDLAPRRLARFERRLGRALADLVG